MKDKPIFANMPKERPRSSVLIFVIACVVASIAGYKYSTGFRWLDSGWSNSRWEPYASNPVLPDRDHEDFLGTVFDAGVFYEGKTWKMYCSWRANRTISYSTSFDGFTWDQDLQFSLGGLKNSKWDTLVSRPFVLKRATGEYLMWYTGQIDKRAMGGKLGLAVSRNGIKFHRASMAAPQIAEMLIQSRSQSCHGCRSSMGTLRCSHVPERH